MLSPKYKHKNIQTAGSIIVFKPIFRGDIKSETESTII